MVTDFGDRLVIMDLGLAAVSDASRALTKVGERVGTLRYMAPEQLHGGDVDGRADVYALGACLYFLLTKRLPNDRAPKRPSEINPMASSGR